MRGLRSTTGGVLAALVITIGGSAAGAVGARAAAAPVPRWGATFCSTITDWRDEIAALQSQYQPRIESATTVQGSLDELEAFLNAAADATDAAAEAQAAAGNPDVKHGAKIEDLFVKGYRGIAKAFRANARRTAKVDATSPDVQVRVRRIQARIERVKGAFNDAVEGVKRLDRKDRLSRRLEALPACAALSG